MDTLQSLRGPVQSQNRVFPVQYFHTGKNLFSLQGSQAMKTGFCLLEILHKENPVFITWMGLQCTSKGHHEFCCFFIFFYTRVINMKYPVHMRQQPTLEQEQMRPLYCKDQCQMFPHLTVHIKTDTKKILKKLLKFIYSEKATKFCQIFPLLLTKVRGRFGKFLWPSQNI